LGTNNALLRLGESIYLEVIRRDAFVVLHPNKHNVMVLA
jgi:hypothetical protein